MNQKKFLAITFGVVLAVAVVVFGYAFYKNKKANAPKVYKFTQVDAPKGKTVDGFPKNLLIGQGAINTSYSLSYENGVKQYTAEYTSTKSADELYKAYIALFTKANDLIGNNVNGTDRASMYVATTKNENINLVIQNIPDKKVRQVIISYTQK